MEVGAHNMHVLASGSRFEALSAEGSTLDGLNIHFGCVDELHAHKTPTVFDVVETGTGKRDDSLLWVITTAGGNRAGICYEAKSGGSPGLRICFSLRALPHPPASPVARCRSTVAAAGAASVRVN